MYGNRHIVFLDSGKGGIPYFLDYHQRDQSQSLIYVADNAFFPYGMKSPSDLCNILMNTIKKIIERLDPLFIVLACNTASVTALKWLRQRLSVPLVGVVPAVKPASAQTTGGHIGLMVTERTANGNYLHDLIGQFANDQVVITVVAGGIVEYIEAHVRTLKPSLSPAMAKLINRVLSEFAEYTVDTVVLGCTHFLYITHLLRSQLAQSIAIVDSRAGVTNRVDSMASSLLSSSTQARAHLPLCYTTVYASTSFEELLANCSIRYAGVL